MSRLGKSSSDSTGSVKNLPITALSINFRTDSIQRRTADEISPRHSLSSSLLRPCSHQRSFCSTIRSTIEHSKSTRNERFEVQKWLVISSGRVSSPSPFPPSPRSDRNRAARTGTVRVGCASRRLRAFRAKQLSLSCLLSEAENKRMVTLIVGDGKLHSTGIVPFRVQRQGRSTYCNAVTWRRLLEHVEEWEHASLWN